MSNGTLVSEQWRKQMATTLTYRSIGTLVNDRCFGCGKPANDFDASYSGQGASVYGTSTVSYKGYRDGICSRCIERIRQRRPLTEEELDEKINKFSKDPKLFEKELRYPTKYRCKICGKHVKACICEPTEVAREIKR